MKKKKKSKKTLGIESSIWRSFMKTESTTQNQLWIKAQYFNRVLFSLRHIFSLYLLYIHWHFYFVFGSCFHLIFFRFFFPLYYLFHLYVRVSRCHFNRLFFYGFSKQEMKRKKKHTPKISVCISSILWWRYRFWWPKTTI